VSKSKISVKLFFKFTLFGWIYAVCTLPVSVAVALFAGGLAIAIFPDLVSVAVFILVLSGLSAFGAIKAYISFSTYADRKDAYLRYREMFDKEYRPSLLAQMEFTPCEKQVSDQLHKEYDPKVKI